MGNGWKANGQELNKEESGLETHFPVNPWQACRLKRGFDSAPHSSPAKRYSALPRGCMTLIYITSSIILTNRSSEDHSFPEVPELINSFFDRWTEDIFNRIISREARATCRKEIWPVARRKLDQLNAVVSLNSLRIPPGNKLEGMKGDRRGQYSIRINDQFRVCFIWTPDGPERVEITDYH